MGARPLLWRKTFHPEIYRVLPRLSADYPRPKGTFLACTHPSATQLNAFDLHVLGTPPALILSHDQTLQKVRETITSSLRPNVSSSATPALPAGEARSCNQLKNQLPIDVWRLVVNVWLKQQKTMQSHRLGTACNSSCCSAGFPHRRNLTSWECIRAARSRQGLSTVKGLGGNEKAGIAAGWVPDILASSVAWPLASSGRRC